MDLILRRHIGAGANQHLDPTRQLGREPLRVRTVSLSTCLIMGRTSWQLSMAAKRCQRERQNKRSKGSYDGRHSSPIIACPFPSRTPPPGSEQAGGTAQVARRADVCQRETKCLLIFVAHSSQFILPVFDIDTAAVPIIGSLH